MERCSTEIMKHNRGSFVAALLRMTALWWLRALEEFESGVLPPTLTFDCFSPLLVIGSPLGTSRPPLTKYDSLGRSATLYDVPDVPGRRHSHSTPHIGSEKSAAPPW